MMNDDLNGLILCMVTEAQNLTFLLIKKLEEEPQRDWLIQYRNTLEKLVSDLVDEGRKKMQNCKNAPTPSNLAFSKLLTEKLTAQLSRIKEILENDDWDTFHYELAYKVALVTTHYVVIKHVHDKSLMA